MATVITRDNATSLLGTELGVSDWFAIDQRRINDFADATEDHQYIHVDAEKAAKTPFGTTIAHGLLTLSLLPRLVGEVGAGMKNVVMGINYGFEKVRFLAPVKVESRVRARVKLQEFQEKNPGQYLLKQEITIEIENEAKPALIAEWLTMLMTAKE